MHCQLPPGRYGATTPYPGPMTTHRPRETIRCGAALRKRGNRCKNEAVSQFSIPSCISHCGARVIDDASRPLFRSAAFTTLSEEVALARYELSALIRDAAPPLDVISGIRTIAGLVKTQGKIGDAIVRRMPAGRGSASPSAR